jgi:hypothetical protein
MGQNILTVPRGDCIAPGLPVVLPDGAFANLVVAATVQNSWPDLRREVAYNRYVDKRNPTVGFVNRDEAAIPYNTVLRFAGRPCLEIGCWRGWSTAHIALGCGKLDVIDPVLADEGFAADVKASLDCISRRVPRRSKRSRGAAASGGPSPSSTAATRATTRCATRKW